MVCARVYILLAVASLAKAQIPGFGFCPDYQPMADFDMERFLGKWYENERYFTFSDVASRCIVTDYAKAPSGKIYVSNEVTNRLTGVKRVIGGYLDLSGKGTEGKMHVKYATSPLSTETTLVVLDTDYNNYAVVWSCNGVGPLRVQNAWVMTRERLADPNVIQHVYGVLDKFNIGRTFFVKTDQAGCAIVASDINAANGITPSSTILQAIGTVEKSASNLSDPSGDLEDSKSEPLPEAESNQPKPDIVAEHILNNSAVKAPSEKQDDPKSP